MKRFRFVLPIFGLVLALPPMAAAQTGPGSGPGGGTGGGTGASNPPTDVAFMRIDRNEILVKAVARAIVDCGPGQTTEPPEIVTDDDVDSVLASADATASVEGCANASATMEITATVSNDHDVVTFVPVAECVTRHRGYSDVQDLDDLASSSCGSLGLAVTRQQIQSAPTGAGPWVTLDSEIRILSTGGDADDLAVDADPNHIISPSGMEQLVIVGNSYASVLTVSPDAVFHTTATVTRSSEANPTAEDSTIFYVTTGFAEFHDLPTEIRAYGDTVVLTVLQQAAVGGVAGGLTTLPGPPPFGEPLDVENPDSFDWRHEAKGVLKCYDYDPNF